MPNIGDMKARIIIEKGTVKAATKEAAKDIKDLAKETKKAGQDMAEAAHDAAKAMGELGDALGDGGGGGGSAPSGGGSAPSGGGGGGGGGGGKPKGGVGGALKRLMGTMKEYRKEQKAQAREAKFFTHEILEFIPAAEGMKGQLGSILGMFIEGAAGGVGFGLALEGIKFAIGAVSKEMERAKAAEEAVATAQLAVRDAAIAAGLHVEELTEKLNIGERAARALAGTMKPALANIQEQYQKVAEAGPGWKAYLLAAFGASEGFDDWIEQLEKIKKAGDDAVKKMKELSEVERKRAEEEDRKEFNKEVEEVEEQIKREEEASKRAADHKRRQLALQEQEIDATARHKIELEGRKKIEDLLHQRREAARKLDQHTVGAINAEIELTKKLTAEKLRMFDIEQKARRQALLDQSEAQREADLNEEWLRKVAQRDWQAAGYDNEKASRLAALAKAEADELDKLRQLKERDEVEHEEYEKQKTKITKKYARERQLVNDEKPKTPEQAAKDYVDAGFDQQKAAALAALTQQELAERRLIEDAYEAKLLDYEEYEQQKNRIAWKYAEARFNLEHEVAGRIMSSAQGSLKQYLVDIADTTKSLKSSFKDMAVSFRNSLIQMVADAAAQQLISLMKQIAILAGGGPATPAMGVGKMAGGGMVRGPGGGKDDLVPIDASNGEFVVKADAVKHYGADFLYALNEKRVGLRAPQKYAAGGLVGSAPAGGAGEAAPTQVTVNNYTGQPVETKESTGPNGEKLVEFIIGRVAKDMARGGTIAKTMQQTYGLDRKGTSRG